MKTKTLLVMGLCAAIGLISIIATTARAAEKENVKIPDTVEGIFKEIHKHHGELAAVVKNKKLADVHHHAFAIRDLAKALPDKAAADKKKQVEGTVKNISKLAVLRVDRLQDAFHCVGNFHLPFFLIRKCGLG